MRILFLTDDYAESGGVETYVLRLMSLLEDRGHTTGIVYRLRHERTMSTAHRLEYHVPYTPYSFSQRERKEAWIKIGEIICKEDPDLIYVHTVYDPEIIALATRNKPTVAYIHGPYVCCPTHRKFFLDTHAVCERRFGINCFLSACLRKCWRGKNPLRMLQRMLWIRRQGQVNRRVDRLIVASRYMRRLLVQNGFDASRIIVLPYFIEEPTVSLAEGDVARLPQVLFAGRLVEEKGAQYLLEAASRLKTPCETVVAGDGSYRPHLEALTNRLGLSERVRFTGWLSRQEMQDRYQACSVTVMPSVWPEPFGQVGLEGMLYCKPAVAFDVGGISDWLEDGFNGFLVQTRDIDGLARQIDLLLGNPALARQLGENGRKMVRTRYSVESHLDMLLAIFEQAISTPTCKRIGTRLSREHHKPGGH